MARSLASSSSAGLMPSRRSPSSTIKITSWVRPARSAAADSARSVPSSEFRLMSVSCTTASASETGGMRSIMIGSAMPARRRRRTFSSRDSPKPANPPSSIARAICGMPATALVTPNSRTPRTAAMPAIRRALAAIIAISIVSVAAVMPALFDRGPAAHDTAGSRRHASPILFRAVHPRGALARIRTKSAPDRAVISLPVPAA